MCTQLFLYSLNLHAGESNDYGKLFDESTKWEKYIYVHKLRMG